MNEYHPPMPSPREGLPAGSRELIFGLFAVLVGLFTANMVLYGGFRLGFAIAGVLSICLSWGYLHRAGCKTDGYSGALLVLSLIITAGFGWSADAFVKGWLFLFLLAGVNLALCLMAGQNRRSPGSVRSLFDAARTVFGFGLGQMDRSCRGVAVAFRSGGALTQRSGAVLAGLGIAVPALAVVIPLLIASDAAFEGLIELLPDFDLYEIFSTVVAGGLLGLFFYTRAVALRHGEVNDGQTREPKKLHVLTMSTALGAVCAVYLAYLFSQLAYFVGGFSGILPEGFTRAEYARRGFFEMTCLAGVNLALMTFGVGKVRHEGRTPGTTRMLCLFIGLVTEFLAASSAAKMMMYIGTYGLTRLRVLTMVIMVFLGITTAIEGTPYHARNIDSCRHTYRGSNPFDPLNSYVPDHTGSQFRDFDASDKLCRNYLLLLEEKLGKFEYIRDSRTVLMPLLFRQNVLPFPLQPPKRTFQIRDRQISTL